MAEDQACSVCLCAYTDPKLLICGHVFCRECLERLLSRRNGKFLSCPICRQDTPIPDSGVAGLPSALIKHGRGTPSYKAVQRLFYPLVLTFEQDLPKLGAKLFERRLITASGLAEASNPYQPRFDRSSAVMQNVLRKIEINQMWYGEFLSVLYHVCEFPLVNELKATVRKEEAIAELKAIAELREEAITNSNGSFDMPQAKLHEGRYPGSYQSGTSTPVNPPAGFNVEEAYAEEADDERFDSEQPKRQLRSARIKMWQKVALKDKYAKLTNLQHLLTQQGDVIRQKDSIIADLQNSCGQKDTFFEGLIKEKENMKKRIEYLEMQCSGAKDEQIAYSTKLSELQKKLHEVEAAEREARTDLDTTRSQLHAAQLDREREVSKLREDFSRQEVLKSEIQAEREAKLIQQKDRALLEERRRRARESANYVRDADSYTAEMEEELRKLRQQVKELEKKQKPPEKDDCTVQ